MKTDLQQSIAQVLFNVAAMLDNGIEPNVYTETRARAYRRTAQALMAGRRPTDDELRGVDRGVRAKVLMATDGDPA